MRTSQVYRRTRPELVIEATGGAALGNCYNASYFKVTSTLPLDVSKIKALRDAGFLGYGQENFSWYVNNENQRVPVPEKVDWRTKPVPTGHDECPLVEMDTATGEVIQVIVDKDGKGRSSKQPFYVYQCETRVDSSD